jgi:hypothetical protein
MADENPKGGPRAVPIIFSDHLMDLLKQEVHGWLAGVEEDLETPEGLKDPEASVREAAVFRRLLEALDRGEIVLPDEEARATIEKATEGYEEAAEYTLATLRHDAHLALLDLLGGERARNR